MGLSTWRNQQNQTLLPNSNFPLSLKKEMVENSWAVKSEEIIKKSKKTIQSNLYLRQIRFSYKIGEQHIKDIIDKNMKTVNPSDTV